jgi:carotenoid cleavage dioxygenase-like enzyme
MATGTMFPPDMMYSGFSAPTRIECDIYDLEIVQGEVPKDLNGTFYRVQPDPAWPPKMGRDIPLNGDGMITAFRFDRGAVDYKSRYVHTPKFVAERAARRALFGAYRNPFTDDASVAGLSRGTANTSVIWHGGRLLALKEDSHPVELDPHTLETRGSYDFGGRLLSNTFTAHPKINPATGDLYCYGYAARGETTLDIALYVIDRSGSIKWEQWVTAPYGCMIHDFGVTANHVLIPITPLCSDMQRLKQGGPHFAWDPEKPSALGVIPRGGSASDLKWFQGPTCHSTHTLNAFDDGDRIHYDTPTGETCVFPFFPSTNGEKWDGARAAPRLTRWTVDLKDPKRQISQARISEFVGDFPRIDDRFAMSNVQIGWLTGFDMEMMANGSAKPGGGVSNAIIQHDLAAGKQSVYSVDPGSAVQEPQFIPRKNGAGQGDGWLVMVVHRLAGMHSDVVLLDTSDLAAGPVATIRLPLRLRRGLHGCWVPADELE